MTPDPNRARVKAAALSTDQLIDVLTDDEGNTVTFCCSNPDFNGLPNECVMVSASWTDWQDRDFRADTRQDCLIAALNACREASGLAALAAADALPSQASEREARLEAEVERLKAEADGEFVEAAVRVMQANPGFVAHDYTMDGITADDFEQFFTEDMNEAWAQVERAEARYTAAEAENARLREALEPFVALDTNKDLFKQVCTLIAFERTETTRELDAIDALAWLADKLLNARAALERKEVDRG